MNKKTTQKNIPEDWTEIRIASLGEMFAGLAGKNKEHFGKGAPFVTYMNVYSNSRINPAQYAYVHVQPEESQNELRYGDVLFTTSSETANEVGIASVFLEHPTTPVYLNSFCFGLRLKDHSIMSPHFAQYFFRAQGFRDQMTLIAQGATRYNLSKKYFLTTTLKIPMSSAEQNRIVAVLETWDKAIEKLAKKIELKKEIKKGLMQNLLTGKIRLPRFIGSWKKIRLGDVGRVLMCKRIFKFQTLESGDIPFYKIGTFGGAPDAYISDKTYTEYRQKYPFPRKGEILISAAGTVGRTVVYDGEPSYFQDSNIVWLSNDEQLVLNSFLFYAYKVVRWSTASGTIARLYNDLLRRIEINAPNLEEQRAISNLLDVADKEISQLEQKLALLKDQKNYLLNNLITGAIRTPETVSTKV